MTIDSDDNTTMSEVPVDSESERATDDPPVIPFPGVAENGSEMARDDRGLAIAYMAEENAGDRRLRFSNQHLLWHYDGVAGIWRRLEDGQIPDFNARLYEFVRFHMPDQRKPSQATSRYRSVRRMLFETLGQYHAGPDAFDANPELIGFSNGVYDVAHDRLLCHSPDHMLTVGRDYEHDPSATCPRFERFLSEVLVRHRDPSDDTSPLVPDPELRQLVQEMMGYCLVAHCRAERGFFLYGDGRNGKSTLIRVIRQVVGEQNACDFDIRQIANPQMNLRLIGKLVAVQSELDAGATIPDARFKTVVSGESLTAKAVFKTPVSFEPFATLIMAGNNLPATRDRSRGMWARTIVIPFLATFEGEAADANLQGIFVPELAGIFNLAIEGYRRLRDNGWRFTEATAAREATTRYREESDPILLWFNDALSPSSNAARILTAELFDHYVAYCSRFRYRAVNYNGFSKRLRGIVDGREGSHWGTTAADGTEFSMSFHRSARSRAYVGNFAIVSVTG